MIARISDMGTGIETHEKSEKEGKEGERQGNE